MPYTLAENGDRREKIAWSQFLQSEFPSYEHFWLKHVVPLTNRPTNIHFKNTETLELEGKTDEDIAISQLHYTILKHLLPAYQIKIKKVDDFSLFVGLSCLTGAQDIAFELLQRYTNKGKYDPWLESRPRGAQKTKTRLSGEDAQSDWKKANKFPLQHIRDYRNKLMHGRTPPSMSDAQGKRLPAIQAVDKYCDWRHVTDPEKRRVIPDSDFEYADTILTNGWNETIGYFEENWKKTLLSRKS